MVKSYKDRIIALRNKVRKIFNNNILSYKLNDRNTFNNKISTAKSLKSLNLLMNELTSKMDNTRNRAVELLNDVDVKDKVEDLKKFKKLAKNGKIQYVENMIKNISIIKNLRLYDEIKPAIIKNDKIIFPEKLLTAELKGKLSLNDAKNKTFFLEPSDIQKQQKFSDSIDQTIEDLKSGIDKVDIPIPNDITYENFWDILLKKLSQIDDYIILVGEHGYTLNQDSRNRLKKIVMDQLIEKTQDITHSDSEILYNLEDVDHITIYNKNNFIEKKLEPEIKDEYLNYNHNQLTQVRNILDEEILKINLSKNMFGLDKNMVDWQQKKTNEKQKEISILNQLINEKSIEEGVESIFDEKGNYKYEFTSEGVKPKYNKKSEGAFFKYLNKTLFDFSRYQIFNDNNENYEDNCLVYALKNIGMSELKLNQIKSMVKNRMIPISEFENICNKLKIKINLHRIIDKKQRIKTYGKDNVETYEIGLFEEHFFIYENTKNTSHSLTNYDEIKDEKDCNQIYIKKLDKYERSEDRYIDSLKLVKLLIENKDNLLKEITYDNSKICQTQFYDKIDNNISNLEFHDSNCREMKYEEKLSEDLDNVYVDFETRTVKHLIKGKEGITEDNYIDLHEPYLCHAYFEASGTEKTFEGKKCAFKMLTALTSNSRLIIHNATYDYRFIIKHLYRISEISRGSHLITSSAYFKSQYGQQIKISVIDSYNLISVALKKFPKMFKLDKIIKEVMPYELYNEVGALEKKYINIDYVLDKYISKEDKYQFLDNIKKWECEDGKGNYNIIHYSKKYCEIDVKIMRLGYLKFKDWMLEITGIDIDQTLTMAGLADRYFQKMECYDGCYEFSGVIQQFLQKFCVGGRCMVSNNIKLKLGFDKHSHKKIQDFDAVSLYPSAMYRMGFLKGKPKIIKDLNYDSIKDKDGYFIEIKLLENMKNRSFPLISAKNKDGIRMFKNDMKNENIFVNKIDLEDLINFNGLKIDQFQIIRGYYFDEGFNFKIQEIIKKVFDERKQKKKEDNAIEICYKLLMNSGYGKTIQKCHDSDSKFFDNNESFMSYLNSNYNYIQSFTKIYDSNAIKCKYIKPINEHFNRAHIGVSILSMSKRIMNEVMCLADDNDIQLFYQDTDSMHLYEDDINKLSKLFKEKYDRELIGKDMGQFHSDFELKDHYDEEKDDFVQCKNIHAIKSIFLGKKSYIDELNGTDKDGNIKTDYHIRLKGIPNSTIHHTCKLMKLTPIELYEKLYNGEVVEFDLTNAGSKVNFKNEADYTIHTLKKFTRSIKF
jgi:hypothetical protein